jgi:hypothetical protein
MMEVYLLSLALSRHRMILPQPQQSVHQAAVLDPQQHACDGPVPALTRIEDPSNIASLHRASR